MKGISALLVLCAVGITTAMLFQCYLLDLLNPFEAILALFLIAMMLIGTTILAFGLEHIIYKRFTRLTRVINKLKGE